MHFFPLFSLNNVWRVLLNILKILYTMGPLLMQISTKSFYY